MFFMLGHSFSAEFADPMISPRCAFSHLHLCTAKLPVAEEEAGEAGEAHVHQVDRKEHVVEPQRHPPRRHHAPYRDENLIQPGETGSHPQDYPRQSDGEIEMPMRI